MTQSILQFTSTDPNTSATTTTLAFGSNVTTGSTILVWTVLNFASFGATPFQDTLGNTYHLVTKAQSSAGPGNQTLYLYAAYNSPGGANTVQMNLGSSQSVRALGIMEVGGTAASPLDGSANNDQTSPGTGAGAVLSGTATSARQPAIAIAFSWPIFTNSAPTAVSPYTNEGTFFGSGDTGPGRCEYRNLTTTGSQQATFTATAGTTEHLSLIVVLDAIQNIALTGVSGSVGATNITPKLAISAAGVSGSAGVATAANKSLIGVGSGSMGIANLYNASETVFFTAIGV